MTQIAAGVWTVNSLDVVAVNTGRRTGGYIPATLILRDGTEITGMVLTIALERLERELAARLLSQFWGAWWLWLLEPTPGNYDDQQCRHKAAEADYDAPSKGRRLLG